MLLIEKGMKTAAQADLQAATAQQPAQSLGRGTVLGTAASALFVLSGYIVNITLGRTLGPGPQSIPELATKITGR